MKKTNKRLPPKTAKAAAFHKKMYDKYMKVEIIEKLHYEDKEFASLSASFTRWSAGLGIGPSIAQAELKGQLSHFKKFIEAGVKITDKFSKEVERAQLIVSAILASDPDMLKTLYIDKPITQLGYFLLIDEDAVYKLVASVGPIMLANPDVQVTIIGWLHNREIASAKLEKLKKSLLSYEYGDPLPRFKDGRTEYSIANRLNKAGTIRCMYSILARLLKHVKAYAKANLDVRKDDLYSQEILTPIVMDVLEKESRALKNLKSDLAVNRYAGLVEAMICFIKSDDDLWHDFEDLRWAPNCLAKAILHKALGISPSKIDKLIYTRQSHS